MNHKKLIEVMETMMKVAGDGQTPEPVRAWLTALVNDLSQVKFDDPRLVKGGPIPTTVGAMADEYSIVREARLAADKAAEAIKGRETEIYNTILSTLNESADTGASGKLYRVQRIEKKFQRVKDWTAFHQWIRENDRFDLLQKRIADKAVNELVEEGTTLPGVEEEDVPTLSFNKVG